MMFEVVALSCVASSILLLGVVLWVVSLKYSHLPGDLGSPVFGNLAKVYVSFVKRTSAESFERMMSVMKAKGETVAVWIGPAPVVVTADPLIIQDMMTKDAGRKKEPFFYNKWHQIAIGAFTSSDADDKWKLFKSDVIVSMAPRRLNLYMETFVRRSLELKASLREQKKEIDVFPTIILLVTDIILETHFGLDYGMLNNKNFYFSKALIRNMPLIIDETINPINLVLPDFLTKLSLCPIITEFHTMVLKGVCQKLQENNYSDIFRDAINHLNNNESAEGSPPIYLWDINYKEDTRYAEKILLKGLSKRNNLNYVYRLFNELFYEGVIPNSVAISSALLFLAIHPMFQRAAQTEQDEIFRGEKRTATLTDLNKMVYLERVIKETLRLVGPPLTSRRTTKDINSGTITIPRNTTLVILMSHAMTNPKYWKEPTKFNPDNFLPENIKKRPKCLTSSFGLAPRNCPGAQFSMHLMKTVLSTVLRYYDATTSLNSGHLAYLPGLMMVLDGPYSLRFRRRVALAPRVLGAQFSMHLMKTVLSTVLRHYDATTSLNSGHLAYLPGLMMVLDGPYSLRFRRRVALAPRVLDFHNDPLFILNTGLLKF